MVGSLFRALPRHELPYPRDRDPPTGQVFRSSMITAICYERELPGELVPVDQGNSAKMPDGGGWAAHRCHMGPPSTKKRARIGYDSVSPLINELSAGLLRALI